MKTKFEYIINLFNNTYTFGAVSPDITYGEAPHGRIHINQGSTRCFEYNQPVDIETLNVIWKPWLGENIPFFFDSDNTELFTEEEGNWTIRFDIVASSFFLLSGWQEYFSDNRDKYGRFQYSESVQHRFDFTRLPLVNYYFDILRTVVEKAYACNITPILQTTQNAFNVCLTHDIDTCETAWLEGSYSAIKKMNFLTPVNLVAKKLFKTDAWFNFSEILSLEKSFGATSTFFFIPTNQPSGGIKNADYNLKDPKFNAVFKMITDHGCESGLHGSAGSSTMADRLKSESKSFPEPVTSNRFHFLLYDPKITPKILEHAGFNIDSSLGFAEHFGFRNSFCLPFQPFNIPENRSVSFYEIPLSIMDGTFSQYLHLSPDQSFDEILSLILEVKKFGGVLTVLWHNTHFSPHKYPGWKELYIKLLSYCHQEHASMQSCSQILNRLQHG